MSNGILSDNRFLVSADSLTGSVLQRFENLSFKGADELKALDLLTRIRAVVILYLVIPMGLLINLPFALSYDFIQRSAQALFQAVACPNPIPTLNFVGVVIFPILFPIRICLYLAGEREALFPIDYKQKLERGTLHPLLRMLETHPRAQEKFDSLIAFEDEIKSHMEEFEKVLFDIARTPGGVAFIRTHSLATSFYNKYLLSDGSEALLDFLNRRNRMDLFLRIIGIYAMRYTDSQAIIAILIERMDLNLTTQVLTSFSYGGPLKGLLLHRLFDRCRSGETQYQTFFLSLLTTQEEKNKFLFLAICWKSKELCPLLIEKGADLEKFFKREFYSEWCPQLEHIEFYLDMGANPNWVFDDNQTPLSMATSRGWVNVANLLKTRIPNYTIYQKKA